MDDINAGIFPELILLDSNILPEETHLTGNIYMRFMNNCNGKLRCIITEKATGSEVLGSIYEFFDNNSGLPVYFAGSSDDDVFFKQELRMKDNQNFYTDDDNRDLSEATLSAAASLYLLHIV